MAGSEGSIFSKTNPNEQKFVHFQQISSWLSHASTFLVSRKMHIVSLK